MTWVVPAPHVSPTHLRRELIVSLMSMEKALLGWEHVHPLLIGAWLRYILKTLEKTNKQKKFQLPLKAFPWMSWSYPELATILFSLDPLVAPMRSNPRRKFFSHSCCNLICCLEMHVIVWQMCKLWLSGDKKRLSSHDYTYICMAVIEQTVQEQGLLPEHRFLKYGTWAKLHSMQGEGRHDQKKKRETWTWKIWW